ENPVVVKTIVSTKLVEKLCEKYGAELKNVLTGFKYIGEVILGLEKQGKEDNYLFGFEESYGYLSGSYVRDKDAVVASMLICEMAATFKKQGKTLAEVIDGLYEEFGYYKNTTLSYEFEGSEGISKMNDIMSIIRDNVPSEIAGYRVLKYSDYNLSVEKDIVTDEEKTIDLPKSNVLQYNLEGENMVIVRPSGTEPKMKIYLTAVGKDQADAEKITSEIETSVKSILGV
ncbi:MAG: phospho-sugar mutase, partial [Ruminococcus sp.]|nr:phospho-sugar mutase [Ruminococcus sp.]